MSSRSKKAKIEEEKGDIFIVEKVLNRRIGKAGREEFLIQWQGFPESDSSWEPKENLQCTEMLEQFEKESAKRDKPSTRRRQKSPEKDTVVQPATTEQAAPNADTEPNTSDRFGLNGKQMKHIVGLTKATGELHFLCKFTDDTAMLVPAKEVNSRYRPFVDEYGSFLHRRMEKRQKRQVEGYKKGADHDDDEDEWPNMPPGYRILTPEEQEMQRMEELQVPEEVLDTFQPTAAHILHDMHTAAHENLLSSFPLESSEDTIDGGDMHDSILSVFDDSSNSSPPPCPIVIDTVPDDDDFLFPGTSG